MCSMLLQLVNRRHFVGQLMGYHLLIKLQYVKRKLFDDNTKTCETPLCNFLFYGAQSQSSIHSYIQYKILQFVI